MSTVAEVRLWGRTIGAVSLTDGDNTARFEYAPEFVGSGIQVAPLTMPLSRQVYHFPALSHASFHGLPGMLADSLPDKFGHAIIDAWLAAQGRDPTSFNAIERLCHTGTRGMGALEYAPATGPTVGPSDSINVAELVKLASAILTRRSHLDASLASAKTNSAVHDMLRIGTSAGGARAKAVIAWNPHSNEVQSGQLPTDAGFEHWLVKFDGVSNNRDKELADPQGYGAIEYAYALMAQEAGINMNPCRLLEEGGRRHFMTRRFDRLDNGDKLHMQSLAGMAHFDFSMAGAYSYEQALGVIRKLGMPMSAIEEQFLRMVFNIVARNQDDHVKNIAFVMDKTGRWSLAPAYDMTYSYNPAGQWTAQHQMTMNGKRDAFTLADFKACARSASMKRGRAQSIVAQVCDAVTRWPEFANQAGVPSATAERIRQNHLLNWPNRNGQ